MPKLHFHAFTSWGHVLCEETYAYHRTEYNTEGGGTQVTHELCYWCLLLPFSSFIQQSHTLNKVQYLAERNVFKITWFYKMMTQVPK